MVNQLLRPLLPRGSNSLFEWLCIVIVYTLLFWTAGNSVSIILLTVYWLFFLKKSFDISSERTRFMLLFCSLYLVSVVGLLYTGNVEDGLFRLQQKSAIFFLPLVFGTIVLPNNTYRIIYIHFIIATCLACLISLGWGLLRFIQTGEPGMISREELAIYPDLNPPMTGLICITAIVILLHHFYGSSRRQALLVTAVVAFLSAYTILMGVRLIIFCLFLILLVFIFKYISSFLYRVMVGLLFISGIVISLLFIPGLNRKWKELVDFSPSNTIVLDKDSSLGRQWGGKSIRLAIWECSEDLIKMHWFAGVGTGDVQDSLQVAYEKRKFYFAAYHNKYNAHNQYLEMWLANGLPGLLIYVLCLVIPLVRHIQHQTALEYTIFLSLIVIMSVTETFLNVNKGTIWYSLFNSIFGFAYLSMNGREKIAKPQKQNHGKEAT